MFSHTQNGLFLTPTALGFVARLISRIPVEELPEQEAETRATFLSENFVSRPRFVV
jgi:hypothetical protein